MSRTKRGQSGAKPAATPPWFDGPRLQQLLQTPLPVPLDLTAYCRMPGQTIVTLHDYAGNTVTWLTLGQVELTPRSDHGRYVFGARLGRGATDFEEDSAWALRFEVIGVQLDMINSHIGTVITAYVAADYPDTFHVPDPGWDPFADAVVCTRKGCLPARHPMVERYVPMANPEAFVRARGRRICIRTGGPHRRTPCNTEET